MVQAVLVTMQRLGIENVMHSADTDKTGLCIYRLEDYIQQAASRQERYTMPDSLQKCSLMENTGHPCLPMPPLKPSGHTQTSL